MGILKEMWSTDLVEGLYADNTFASRSVDHSAFVNSNRVHVPNAGSKPNVVKNRSTFPGTAADREDVDLDYAIDSFSIDPIRVGNVEQLETSYDKRASVLNNSRLALIETVHRNLLDQWGRTATQLTTGKIDKPEENTVVNGLRGAVLKMNEDEIPQEGRCVIMLAKHYDRLLNELAQTANYALASTADFAKGTVGKFLGLDIYVANYVGEPQGPNGWGAIAWQQGCVARALGEVKIFDNAGNALYYGDVISAEVLSGGTTIRADKKGVYALSTKYCFA